MRCVWAHKLRPLQDRSSAATNDPARSFILFTRDGHLTRSSLRGFCIKFTLTVVRKGTTVPIAPLVSRPRRCCRDLRPTYTTDFVCRRYIYTAGGFGASVWARVGEFFPLRVFYYFFIFATDVHSATTTTTTTGTPHRAASRQHSSGFHQRLS